MSPVDLAVGCAGKILLIQLRFHALHIDASSIHASALAVRGVEDGWRWHLPHFSRLFRRFFEVHEVLGVRWKWGERLGAWADKQRGSSQRPANVTPFTPEYKGTSGPTPIPTSSHVPMASTLSIAAASLASGPPGLFVPCVVLPLRNVLASRPAATSADLLLSRP